MRVFGYATDDRARWTAPFPESRFGIKFRLLGGDLLSPDTGTGTMRPGREGEARNWFNVIPVSVVREYYGTACKAFLSVRIGTFGLYMGHKVFGVDSAAYLDYPKVSQADVYAGSQAMTGFTARMTNKLKT